MATLKQIDANRRNALKSTGPITPEGKAAVSLNALRHGLRSLTVVLPGESRDEFHQLCDDLEAEWRPQTRTEQFYLEQMAISQWKLTRMEIGEADVFRQPTAAKEQLPLLDRLWQAQSRMERSYARARQELQRLQLARRVQYSDQPEEEISSAAVPPGSRSSNSSKYAGLPHNGIPAAGDSIPAAFSSLQPDCPEAS